MIKLIFSLTKPSTSRRQQSSSPAQRAVAQSRTIARSQERFMSAVQSSDR